MTHGKKMKKLLHYCWLGPNDLPNKEAKCIETWKEVLPDYQLKLWNEQSFDLVSNSFAAQAYKNSAYAFASDYARTRALYDHGGLYLDTDVEILEGFREIANINKCFLGFETRSKIGTAVMCFTPQHPVIKEFLDFYERNDFVDERGNFNTIANVSILTDILTTRGLKADGTRQKIDGIEIFPREFFYPKKISDQQFRITEDTAAVHKCSNSWMTERERVRGKNPLWINIMRPLLRGLKNTGKRFLGEDLIQEIEVQVRNKLK